MFGNAKLTPMEFAMVEPHMAKHRTVCEESLIKWICEISRTLSVQGLNGTGGKFIWRLS